MFRRTNLTLFLILAVSVLPYWIGIGASTLWDANEAYYAETPRVMIETGDYVTPSFNDNPRTNKPPLTYWIIAGSYRIFGVSEWSERLPIVLAAMGLIAAAFVIGKTAWGVRAGLWAAIVMATLPRLLMHSRRTSIDVFLSLFMGLTLLFFVLAELRPERRKLWLCLMYACVGFGFMTKGPVAAVLPGAVFLIYLALGRRLRDIGKMMLPAGIAIFLAIVVPWYLLIYQRHGSGYIVSFILNENISRYTEEGWGPQRSFFYLLAMIGDPFPWSLLLIAALVCVSVPGLSHRLFGRRDEVRDEFSGVDPIQIARLLALWIVVIVAFYSFSRNQQDQYIMPTFLAAAALAGAFIDGFVRGAIDRARWIFAIGGGVLALIGSVFLFLSIARSSIDLAGTGAIGVALLAGGLATVIFAVRGSADGAVSSQAVTVAAVMWVFVLVVLPDFERYKPVKALSEVIEQNAGPGDRVGYYRFTAPTMVFYLRRPVLEYFHEEELLSAFSGEAPAYMIMREDEYRALREMLPTETRVLGERPLLRIRLNELFKPKKQSGVVLVTNAK